MDSTPKNTTKFGPGNKGKPKGATNKITREVKAMITEALDQAGGVDYLVECAKNPRTASAFLTLVGKVLHAEQITVERMQKAIHASDYQTLNAIVEGLNHDQARALVAAMACRSLGFDLEKSRRLGLRPIIVRS